MKKYIEIQKEAIKDYNINLDTNSKCRSRTHAHCDKSRRICKWNYSNSIQATFTLFHEIGHIETHNNYMRRCESEFYATEFAIELANKYDLKIPMSIIDSYQQYIFRELDRGLRRGGTNYPSKEYLTLKSL